MNGTMIQAEGGTAIIDKGGGTAAFDGQNVILGQQSIFWNGALRLVKGDGGFIGGYDANGNLTSRVVNGAATLLSYDAENHLIDVGGAVTTSFVYDGDGNRVKSTGSYMNLAAGIVPTGDVTINNAQVITDNDPWADDSSQYATATSGLHYVKIDLGAVYSVNKVNVWHYANDGRTYHSTKTQVSADGTSWVTVYDSAVSGEYQETAQGKEITFATQNVRYVRDYVNGNTVNVYGHWVEIEVWGYGTVTYVGNYFEWTGSTNTMEKYYYAGSTRVAVRRGSDNLYWLLGDHLGSQAITADASGSKISEVRYYPWGEDRYFAYTSSTAYRFTGQWTEFGLGLMFYGARFYDPSLGRFISPDTLVPGGVQGWDRYAYSSGNPVKYIDPTGHWPDLSDIFSLGATICDVTATAVSIVGVGIEAFAAAGGEILTPIPGIDSGTGLIAGIGFYNLVLNPIENSLSLASLALVSLSDAVAGNDQINRITDPRSGQQATEFTLGADTTFSLVSTIVGNTPLTPDAVSDTLANIATVYYDVNRLNDDEPIWGLRRFQFVQPDDAPGYIKLNRYHEENHGR